jgi:hypothetical protein
MSLNIVAGWVAFGCVLLTAVTLGMFLVAAGSGYSGWAALAGSACVLAILTAIVVVGATVRHDRKANKEMLHFP